MGSPQVAKLLKAAQLLKHGSLAQLFPDKSAVPVAPAYELMGLMERPGAKEVVLKAAQNLLARGEGARPPAAILKFLASSLDRSRQVEPLKRELQRRAVIAYDDGAESERESDAIVSEGIRGGRSRRSAGSD